MGLCIRRDVRHGWVHVRWQDILLEFLWRTVLVRIRLWRPMLSRLWTWLSWWFYLYLIWYSWLCHVAAYHKDAPTYWPASSHLYLSHDLRLSCGLVIPAYLVMLAVLAVRWMWLVSDCSRAIWHSMDQGIFMGGLTYDWLLPIFRILIVYRPYSI